MPYKYNYDINLPNDCLTETEYEGFKSLIELKLICCGYYDLLFDAGGTKLIKFYFWELWHRMRDGNGMLIDKSITAQLINKLVDLKMVDIQNNKNVSGKANQAFNINSGVVRVYEKTYFEYETSVSYNDEYQIYMHSKEWRKLRKRILSERSVCEICGATNCELHLHHLTYDNFKHEKDEDLQVLCLGCHENVHGKKIGYH